MANPYRELFNAPGARNFVLAGMIARMPISMTGIGVITMLSQLKGGYALAVRWQRCLPWPRRFARHRCRVWLTVMASEKFSRYRR